jgi:hypothetical protein
MCPWSLVIGGTRDRLLELVVRPAQRYRATGSPDFAIDKYGGTTRRRRLSCADDHGGAGAILGKGFDLPNHRYESALVELADAANGVARHTTIQKFSTQFAATRCNWLQQQSPLISGDNSRKRSF